MTFQRAQTIELGDRTCLHLEGLAVVITIVLGGLPGGIRALVLQVIHFHLDFLVEGRNESGELIALVQTLQMVFTHIEGAPHIAHDRDAHDWGTETYQLAYLRINVAYLALALSHLDSLLQEILHYIHGALRSLGVVGCHALLLLTCTVLRHLILASGCCHLSLCSLVGSEGLVAFF